MNGLTKHQTVTEIVQIYEQARADIVAGFALIADAEQRLSATFSHTEYGSDIHIRDRWRGHANIRFDAPADTLEMLKRDIWARIVDRLEIQRIASVKRWKEIEAQIENGGHWECPRCRKVSQGPVTGHTVGRCRDCHVDQVAVPLPEITVDNVMRWGQAQRAALPELLKEAVREVFDFLRPPGSPYKTNTEFEVGRRVIIEYGVELGFHGRFTLNYHRDQFFTALDNVLHALDGKGVPKTPRPALYAALRDSEGGRGETPYYRFKAFRKGTLHLEFTRMDLIKRLNEIAGGKRLRGSEAA